MSGATVTESGERAVARRVWSRTLAFTIAATAALAACSCSGDDDDPPPPNTTESRTEEEEVETAYLAYWDMLTRLSGDPDPHDPEIAERAAGQAQSEVIDGLNRLIADGQRAEPGPLYAHNVLSTDVSGREAQARDCAVDDSTIVDATTGDLISGGSPVTVLLEVTLLRSGAEWRVEEVQTIDSWSGVTTCEQ